MANECLLGSERFVVGINISSDNKIRVFIDGDRGVNIDHCVEVSRHIEKNFDRDKEDFELNVSSAGVDQPFVLLRQYTNNINNKVKVTYNNGDVIKGVLQNADNNRIEILEEIKSKYKKNTLTSFGNVISIPMSNIKETKRIITF
ncbi:MAG: ribosome assembly cofactor RimP [Bacteroidales bacterium]|nr:ribosome assembly cofactor RimP [Bacteroidales bacterium]